jgi:hypothetical protein
MLTAVSSRQGTASPGTRTDVWASLGLLTWERLENNQVGTEHKSESGPCCSALSKDRETEVGAEGV